MPFPDRIGRYDYRGTIGVGGFAAVLRCYDEALDSLVAVKVLGDTWAIDPEIRARFVQEAKLLRRIHNEHVVTVHDSGELADGRPYFVMDYADRGTLEDRLGFTPPGRPIDATTTRTVVLALADGLAALHRAGIVHRDIKPGNMLLQSVNGSPVPPSSPATEIRTSLIEPVERILIGDLGLAKDLVASPSEGTIIGGTQGFQSPEQREPNATISPAADVYAASAVVWRLLHGARPPDHRDLARVLTEVAAPWREVFEQGFAFDPEQRFASIETWRDALLSALDAVDLPSRPGRTSFRSETGVLPCPYKGLAAYEPEDVDYFFGREALVDQLVRRLRRDSVLVVGGPSGSGKSSLVRAGLIPAVANGALPGSQGWRVALFTPGTRPLGELHYQLTAGNAHDAPTLEDLRANPALARHTSKGDAPLLLCIDQFEELFTLCSDPAEQAAFIDALAAHLDPADSTSRGVLAIRADFYGACARFPWLARRITDNQVLVGPMDRSELRRAIEQPARRAGLSIETGLIDAVLDEAGEESGSLPLVAHALVETWTRRRHNTLTLDGFRAAGGVAGAIAKSADTVYDDELDDEQRRAARRLLLRLVTPGDDSPDTRRRMSQAELDRDERSDLLRTVIAKLTSARLLTVDDTSVAIAHEALIRTWPRFRAWIEDDRENLLIRQRISRAAIEWEAQHRDPDLLYRGTPLSVASEWAAQNRVELNLLEHEFLETAVAERDAALHAAEQQSVRRRRVRRGVVGALAALTVAALVSASLAVVSSRRSDTSSERANARFGASLAASGERFIDADPYLAMILAVESGARTREPTPDARRVLVASRQSLANASIVPVGSPIDAGNAKKVTIDPSGQLAATGSRDGVIKIWDLKSRRVRTELTGHTEGIERLVFSPDGTLLASAAGDGTVRMWAVRGHEGFPRGGATFEEFENDDRVWSTAFSPDGTLLAAATENGIIRLYDVETRTAGRTLPARGTDYLSLAFSPDGETLVAGNGDGELSAWSVSTGEPRFGPVNAHNGNDVWELAYSPDGRTIVTSSSDGTARFFDATTGAAVQDRRPFVAPDATAPPNIKGVAFGPDGTWLIAGAADGRVRIWDPASTQTTTTTLASHRGAIIEAALSIDGSRFVTLARDETLRVWDLNRRSSFSRTVAEHDADLLALAGGDNETHVVTGDAAGGVRLWDVRRGTSATIAEGGAEVRSVALNASLVAAGGADGVVRVWRRNGNEVWRAANHEGAVSGVAFAPNDDWLVSAGVDGAIRFRTPEGRPDGEPLQLDDEATRVAVSTDGELVAAAGRRGTVRIWEVGSREMRGELPAQDNTVWSVAFSPDGTRLATASADEYVIIWSATTLKPLQRLTGHGGGATDVRFSPDGRTLLSASGNGPLRLWDVETGDALGEPLAGHEGFVWQVAWLPDGEQFLSAGVDGTLRVWDILSIDRACALGLPAFDAEMERRFLGADDRLEACTR